MDKISGRMVLERMKIDESKAARKRCIYFKKMFEVELYEGYTKEKRMEASWKGFHLAVDHKLL